MAPAVGSFRALHSGVVPGARQVFRFVWSRVLAMRAVHERSPAGSGDGHAQQQDQDRNDAQLLHGHSAGDLTGSNPRRKVSGEVTAILKSMPTLVNVQISEAVFPGATLTPLGCSIFMFGSLAKHRFVVELAHVGDLEFGGFASLHRQVRGGDLDDAGHLG
ncbi:MAG: hypothetical protein ACYCSR_13820 [Thiomonas sp.]